MLLKRRRGRGGGDGFAWKRTCVKSVIGSATCKGATTTPEMNRGIMKIWITGPREGVREFYV